MVLLFSSCHCFFLGFTDSLFSSLVVVVVVVEAGTGTGRVGQGGNTKNRVGEGEMVLILGDYLGPQGVGEGENCVYFTDDEERGENCVYFTRWGR